jgi:glycosyltransferase involved in cell wall biosynthesis
MDGIVLKTINKFRRIYHRKRYAKHFFEKSVSSVALPYNGRPRVTAVVQLFNKRQNIEAIVGALLSSTIEEIIVIDDGSSDGALEILPRLLVGKNHFIIRSNDLFEVRTYSRALDFARGEIVALLQDDDLPPPDGSWVEDAMALFDRHPKLAILGGRDGLELKLATVANSLPSLTYDLVNHRNGERVELPFTFVDTVNRAPILLRREAIQRLGGIDNTFAPFQCDDVDLCLHAWKAGLQVGLYSTGFVRDVGMGGMRLFNAERLPEQAKKNWKIIYDRYGTDVADGYFTTQVANARHSELASNMAVRSAR